MEAARPAIAVCAPLERASWAVWDMPAVVVSRMYLDAVWSAGGMPLVIPPDPHITARPDDVLDRVDGIMMIGGADMDAGTYGAEPHASAEPPQYERDRMEMALARRAAGRGLPLLGICRGLQVINVAHGGTLTQHLPDALGHEEHMRTRGTFDGNDHDVDVVAGSLAEAVVGQERHRVYSHHHQAVERVGGGLRVTARSDDGTVEALERDGDGGFLLGVQWHPEADTRSPVIGAFVRAARLHMDAARA